MGNSISRGDYPSPGCDTYQPLGCPSCALPATALALGGVALLDEYLPTIANKLAWVARIDWFSLKLEGSARWPEVAGMIIGQSLIFGFLLLARGKPRLISK